MKHTEKTSRPTLKRPLIVCLLASLCCLLWGSAAPGIKLGYRFMGISDADTWSMTLFAGIRFVIAGILVVLFVSIREKRFVLPHRGNWGRVLCVAVFLTFGQYFFYFIGVGHASGTDAAIMSGTSYLCSILMTCFVFRQEKCTARKMLGCALSFLGIIVMNFGGETGGFKLLGEGFLLFSSICAAVGTCQSKKWSDREEPVVLTGWQFFLGGIMLIVLSLISGGRIPQVNIQGMAILVYLSFLSATAWSLWNLLIKENSVSAVSIYGFLNPLFGVFISALVLGEFSTAASPKTLIALLLVCAGVVVINLPGRKERRDRE